MSVPDLERIDALTNSIKPILAGHHPAEQGAALAQLVSLWIAGHFDQIREDVLTSFVAHVRELVTIDRVAFDQLHERVKGALDRQGGKS